MCNPSTNDKLSRSARLDLLRRRCLNHRDFDPSPPDFDSDFRLGFDYQQHRLPSLLQIYILLRHVTGYCAAFSRTLKRPTVSKKEKHPPARKYKSERGIHAAQEARVHITPEEAAMGEEQVRALNAPAKDSLQSSPIQSIAGHDTPVWNTIPTAILKPKIPVPSMTRTTKEETPPVTNKQWNTSKLGLRVGADTMAAGAAGILVAPIITIIDKGIIENASGRNTLGVSLRKSAMELLSQPHRFMASKPFVLIFSLYFGTYLTANTIDTVSSTLQSTSVTSTTAGTPKFLATSSANLALCLYKDNQFTKLFSAPGSTPRPVPLPTFALFTVRDCLTIFASFNLPPLLAPHFEAAMGDEVKKYMGAASVAQFVTPAAVQLVSTPLHLLGLDLYNRPAAPMAGQDGRLGKVVGDWAKSAMARICRIVPAFGVGGVVNTKVRRNLMGRLE